MIDGVWRSLPGWLNVDGLDGRWRDVDLLQQAARDVPDGQAIVEVGSWAGQSAFAMAEAVRDRGVEIHCFDSYPEDAIEAGTLSAVGARDIFAAAIQGHAQHRIVLHEQIGEMGGRTWAGPPIGLLHVDGDHCYGAVLADLQAWSPHLAPDATIVMDDWDACFTVRQAAMDALGDGWTRPALDDEENWAFGRVRLARTSKRCPPASLTQLRAVVLASCGNQFFATVEHPWERHTIEAAHRAFASIVPIDVVGALRYGARAEADVALILAAGPAPLALYGIRPGAALLWVTPCDVADEIPAVSRALASATAVLPSASCLPRWRRGGVGLPVACHYGTIGLRPASWASRRGLLLVGTQRGQKRAEEAIRALAGLPVSVIGWSRDDVLDEEGRKAGAEIVGRQPYRQTLWRISRARALVCNSTDEGFYLPGAEAALSAVPLIAPRLPVFEELWGDLPRYFATDAEMREAALSALEGGHEWQERGQAMRERALVLDLTVEGYAKRLAAIAKDAVAACRAAS